MAFVTNPSVSQPSAPVLTLRSRMKSPASLPVLYSCDSHYEGLWKSQLPSLMSKKPQTTELFYQNVAKSLSVSSSGGTLRPVVRAVFERFTERAVNCVVLAQQEAKAMGREEVGTEQILLGLIYEDRSKDGFLQTGVTIERAREAYKAVLKEVDSTPESKKPVSELGFSAGAKKVFEEALEESRKLGNNYIAPEHLTLALLAFDDGGASRLLDRLRLRKEKLRVEAISRLQGDIEKQGRSAAALAAAKATVSTQTNSSRQSNARKEKSALYNFCVDITARARDGKIDPVIGREKEVQRVVEILARRTKNNPILLGEPGVGKTAIAEGLAMRIVDEDVPLFLKNKRVMSLDIAALLGGTKERGEFETRVTSLIAEVVKAGDVVLLIDEVHTLVGSGSVARSGPGTGLDISNLLKPALARGQLQCIGATTLAEHRLHIEKDKALARRFQPVIVNEPSKEDALLILMGLKERYERHHRCVFSPDALEAAVTLSARYIADRFLPDKAIDLMDEAGSRARITAFRNSRSRESSILRQDPADYWREIRSVQTTQGAVSALVGADSAFATASQSLSSLASSVIGRPSSESVYLDTAVTVSADDDAKPMTVTAEDIAEVASLWSGIPVHQMTEDEQKKLLELESVLQTRVVGQNDAVAAISRAIRRARVGIQSTRRPIAAMLFCGPTGVGKTELTKAMAEHYFGSTQSLVRVDMSEYMERHTVSKLIGSPPGYVGYGEGGTLTEAVRRRPYSVVLLDEIEKAHPDVFNMLLQMFEDGHLTDSQGRRVSFRNTLIIMTSNVGSTSIARGGGARFGFDLSSHAGEQSRYDMLKETVTTELKNFFRPELLNRIDEIVVFRSLEQSQVRSIVDIMLKETVSRVQSRGVDLKVSEALIAKICAEGYDRVYGARPLRRAMTRLLEDAVSEALLLDDYKEGDTAMADLEGNGDTVIKHLYKEDASDHSHCIDVDVDVHMPVMAVVMAE